MFAVPGTSRKSSPVTTRRSSAVWSSSRKVLRAWRAMTTYKCLLCISRFEHILITLLQRFFQVVDVAIYFYFALSLIGNQELESHPEMFFPIFLVLKFIFFIGWLKVSIMSCICYQCSFPWCLSVRSLNYIIRANLASSYRWKLKWMEMKLKQIVETNKARNTGNSVNPKIGEKK